MDSLATLAQADFAVQLHVVCALVSIGMLPFVMWRKTRDRMHKIMGYTWAVAMAGTALSSFAISNFGMVGPFSPLHALAVLTLWTLYSTIRAAIRRDIKRHKTGLRNLATYGLGIPMVLNFLPERLFTRAFFEGNGWPALWASAVIVALIVLWRLWVREDRPMQKVLARLPVLRSV